MGVQGGSRWGLVLYVKYPCQTLKPTVQRSLSKAPGGVGIFKQNSVPQRNSVAWACFRTESSDIVVHRSTE